MVIREFLPREILAHFGDATKRGRDMVAAIVRCRAAIDTAIEQLNLDAYRDDDYTATGAFRAVVVVAANEATLVWLKTRLGF